MVYFHLCPSLPLDFPKFSFWTAAVPLNPCNHNSLLCWCPPAVLVIWGEVTCFIVMLIKSQLFFTKPVSRLWYPQLFPKTCWLFLWDKKVSKTTVGELTFPWERKNSIRSWGLSIVYRKCSEHTVQRQFLFFSWKSQDNFSSSLEEKITEWIPILDHESRQLHYQTHPSLASEFIKIVS